MVTVHPLSPSQSESSLAAFAAATAALGHACIAIRGSTQRVSPASLPEAERLEIRGARSERQGEFATGRTLARRALAALGLEADAIPRGAAREPIWPAGVTGSISHSGELCVAALAMQTSVRSIGIDIELTPQIEPALWPSICSPTELVMLESLPAFQRPDEVARVFSSKEAAFKCQFPLTGRWIDFSAVSVTVSGDGRFTVHETSPGLPALPGMRGVVLLDRYGVTALAMTEAAHTGPCVTPREPTQFSDDLHA